MKVNAAVLVPVALLLTFVQLLKPSLAVDGLNAAVISLRLDSSALLSAASTNGGLDLTESGRLRGGSEDGEHGERSDKSSHN